MTTALRLAFIVFVALSVLVNAGCATPPVEPSESVIDVERSGRRGFMGLDDEPLAADWENWTPSRSQAAPGMEPFRSFDSWLLTEQADRETVWASLFSLVDFARGYLPSEYAPTVRAIMTLLDPTRDDVVVDVVFVVGTEAATEGALIRAYRTLPNGGTPGVLLELRREAGKGENPWTIGLHLHSGYEEAPSVVVHLGERSEVAWRPAGSDQGSNVVDADIAAELAVVRDIVVRLWQPMTGNGYIEPPWAVDRKHGLGPVDFAPGHGANIDLRPIENVLIDTVFPPRIDLGDGSAPEGQQPNSRSE